MAQGRLERSTARQACGLMNSRTGLSRRRYPQPLDAGALGDPKANDRWVALAEVPYFVWVSIAVVPQFSIT